MIVSLGVAVPEKSSNNKSENDQRRQPRYHVLLWDDNQHTFLYVIRMLRELFGYELERAQQLAVQVDAAGSGICLTTTKEHAELKRDQIHSYGRDQLVDSCVGSMSCSIEPEE